MWRRTSRSRGVSWSRSGSTASTGTCANASSTKPASLGENTASSAAIRRVAADDAVFSPRLAGFVLDAFAHVPVDAVDPDLDQLTPREREVLRHIARGYAYKEIGRQLDISTKTV